MTAGPLLLIGATGQVGRALLAAAAGRVDVRATARTAAAADALASELGTPVPVLDLEQMTLSDAGRVLELVRPASVVIAAAFSHVDGNESAPEKAYRSNRDAPVMLARAAAARGVRVVFLSSDYVFDGADGPCDEDAPVRPLSVYGRAKAEAEARVREIDPAAWIVRTTWVFGPDRLAKNFAYQLAERIRTRQEIRLPSDQYSTPTYNRDLAAAILDLLALTRAGTTVHVAGPELLSRLEFARRIAASFGDAALAYVDAHTTTMASELLSPVRRPLRGGLKTDRLRQLLPPGAPRPRPVDLALTHWREHPATTFEGQWPAV